jgi:hypothetical protein
MLTITLTDESLASITFGCADVVGLGHAVVFEDCELLGESRDQGAFGSVVGAIESAGAVVVEYDCGWTWRAKAPGYTRSGPS